MGRPPLSRDLYLSPNGDRWLLLRDPSDGRSFVRHVANPASGGHVTDVALAAFLAAEDGSIVSMQHIVRALKREYQKVGKLVTEAEFGSYTALVRSGNGIW